MTPGATGPGAGWLGLVALAVVLTITVAPSDLGGDDDPSGGGTEGLAPAAAGEPSLPGR